jgi:hypothetical protein
MKGDRHVKPVTIWDTMPRPDEFTSYATEEELDEEYLFRRKHEDDVVKQYGPEDSRARILEENIEMLVERLNAYEKYVEEVERWRQKIQSRYMLVDKREILGSDDG